MFENLYKQMKFIRLVEEAISERYSQGNMRCPVHLSIGQECVPALFSEFVSVNDFAISTHRGHAHYLAKGGNLNSMIAELYGKESGCSSGKGGSMHLIDLDVNFMGTSAIVGNSIPIGVGLALTCELKNSESISCVFLGDGAVEEGVFYESLNFASVRNLPVLFICENNLYSVYSPLSVRQPLNRSISKMVNGIGVKSNTSDLVDLGNAKHAMKKAFEYVRNIRKPYFIEYKTYRWREHCGPNFDNNLGYRSLEEFDNWKKIDPLENLEVLINDEVKFEITKIIKSKIVNAFKFAENSNYPHHEESLTGLFA